MPVNRKKRIRTGSGIITERAVEYYKAGDQEGLMRELGLDESDRNPLCPENKCWALLATWSDPENQRRAERIRDEIERRIKAQEGGQDANDQTKDHKKQKA